MAPPITLEEMLPYEVVLGFLYAVDQRVAVRAVASTWKSAVDSHFELKRLMPPERGCFSFDFEFDRSPTASNQIVSKDLYCAKFSRVGDEQMGCVEGEVSFLNWDCRPRAKRQRRDSRYRLDDADACALWRLASNLLEQRKAASEQSRGGSTTKETMAGHLIVTEGIANGEPGIRRVVGKLPVSDSERVKSLLDQRSNNRAVSLDVPRSEDWFGCRNNRSFTM